MLDRPAFYDKNLLETFFEPENGATYDMCNICNEPISSWDVSAMAPEADGGFFVESYKVMIEIGVNDICQVMEDESIAHMLAEHEPEVTLVSMDADNTDLLRQMIGDKASVPE